MVLNGANTGTRKILRMDKLVLIATPSYNPDRLIVLNKLKEYGQQAEAATVNDGWAAYGDDVDILRKLCKNTFCSQLRAAIHFDWVRDVFLRHGTTHVLCPQAVG